MAVGGAAGQQRCGRHLRTAGMALWLSAVAIWTPVLAQDVLPRLSFDLSSGLTYNDNPDLATTGSDPRVTLDSRFGLTLNTTTREERFILGFSGVARIGSDDAFALRDPGLNLSYSRQNPNSSISVTGSYERTPIDLFEPVSSSDGMVNTTDILAKTGTIISRTAGLNFATGLQRPLGFDLVANVSSRDYSDTTDPDVYGSTSQSLKTGLHLRFEGGREVSVTANASASDFDDATDTTRNNSDLSLGYTQDVRPDLTLQASLGQSMASTRKNGALDSESNGTVGSLGLQVDLANGSADVTLTSDRDSLGARQTLSFGRSMELPSGKLATNFGFSARSGGDAQLVGNLSYMQDLPADSFGVSLSRQITLNEDDQDVVNTVLGMTYQHKINDLSQLGLSVNLQAMAGGGDSDVSSVTRQTVTTSYSRDLTAEWKMTTGYEFRSLDEAGSNLAQSNSVFLTVSRKFILRP